MAVENATMHRNVLEGDALQTSNEHLPIHSSSVKSAEVYRLTGTSMHWYLRMGTAPKRLCSFVLAVKRR
jgi:hypothetical protein